MIARYAQSRVTVMAVIKQSCVQCACSASNARGSAWYCSSAGRQRAYRQRPRAVIRNAQIGVTPRRRRDMAQRTVEQMAIALTSITPDLGGIAIDPADVQREIDREVRL